MSVTKRVDVFLGPGGVGKTTLSSSYALNLNEKNKEQKILLITIDPSKRLKDVFQMKALEKEKEVLPNLWVSLNHRGDLFKDFVERSLNDDALKEFFFKSKILQALLDDLAVAQEFTSFYELHKAFYSNKYDYIVIDTPPLQNSADFMASVDKMEKLFSSAILELFIGHKNQNIFYKLLFKSREVAFKVLRNLTGADFVRELEIFFKMTEVLRSEILKVISETKMLLKNEAKFRMVCNHSELSLKALNLSFKKLSQKKDLKIEEVYVNNYSPKNNSDSVISEMSHLNRNTENTRIEKSNRDLSDIENLKSILQVEVVTEFEGVHE